MHGSLCFMSKTPEDEDRYMVPGLARGLAVLDAFRPDRQVLTLSEIARILDLSRSAVFRTVYTLTHLGYLTANPSTQAYQLGPAVLRLGQGYMADRELVQIALPELERLRDATDWSAHLGVRDGRSVLYLLRVPSRMGMGSIVHVGSRLPAAATTMGRALLTDLDEASLVAIYRDETLTHAPGTTPRSVAEVLAQWRRDIGRDTIVQLGNFERGIASVAAPIRDMSGGVVAAINATRAYTTEETIDPEVIDHVRNCAARISVMLGRG